MLLTADLCILRSMDRVLKSIEKKKKIKLEKTFHKREGEASKEKEITLEKNPK